jgi:hypothetical protein
MHDTQPVRLGQTLANLSRDKDRLAGTHLAHHPEDALQVLARHVLHGDEMGAAVVAQVEHAADVTVRDLAGETELV